MVEQEVSTVTSSHVHTKANTTYYTIYSENDVKNGRADLTQLMSFENQWDLTTGEQS